MLMIPVRVFFSKTGRAKYTSHLDTMRTMSRALKRSGLPVWYTQGFNPHLYSTFSLPIALGYESECESMDIRLVREMDLGEVADKLNRSLPPGFKATRAAAPVMEPSAIAWADYRVTLRYLDAENTRMRHKLEDFLRQPAIEVQKRTKKGEKTLDIRPLVQLLEAGSESGVLELTLRLASGNAQNINPTLFLKAFYDFADKEPDGVRIIRTGIYNKDLQIFL